MEETGRDYLTAGLRRLKKRYGERSVRFDPEAIPESAEITPKDAARLLARLEEAIQAGQREPGAPQAASSWCAQEYFATGVSALGERYGAEMARVEICPPPDANTPKEVVDHLLAELERAVCRQIAKRERQARKAPKV